MKCGSLKVQTKFNQYAGEIWPYVVESHLTKNIVRLRETPE